MSYVKVLFGQVVVNILDLDFGSFGFAKGRFVRSEADDKVASGRNLRRG